MHNCKKTELRTFTVFSALVYMSLFPISLYAELNDGFIVRNAELNQIETKYLLNADIEFRFSKEALQALEHGIALQIDIEMQTKQIRKWIRDKKISEEVLSQRLEHHPLREQYLVTNLNSGIKHDFHNLNNALEFMGTISDHPFLEPSTLEQGQMYSAQIRARLNTESLPAPLRLSAYISSDWRLSSPWYKLVIKQ